MLLCRAGHHSAILRVACSTVVTRPKAAYAGIPLKRRQLAVTATKTDPTPRSSSSSSGPIHKKSEQDPRRARGGEATTSRSGNSSQGNLNTTNLANYDYSKSTAEIYASDSRAFAPRYAAARASLDYSYHRNPVLARQELQDDIITDILAGGTVSHEPWLIFTAGAMGAGKSWCMRQLSKKGYFKWDCFVQIDPDQIRQLLPEWAGYVEACDTTAGRLTHDETSLISQVALDAALQVGKHVLVDGSLRDWQWHRGYIEAVRREYPERRIAIIHVVARPETVYRRAERRGRATGRVIPRSVLEKALQQVPHSVEMLAPLVDYTVTITNEEAELALLSGAASWTDFKERWGVCDPHCEDPEEGMGCLIKF